MSALLSLSVYDVAWLQVPRVNTSVLEDGVSVKGVLDMGGHKLINADIQDSALTGLDELGVTWLAVRGGQPSRMAYLSENSTLASLPSASVSPEGAVTFSKVTIGEIGGNIECNNYQVGVDSAPRLPCCCLAAAPRLPCCCPSPPLPPSLHIINPLLNHS